MVQSSIILYLECQVKGFVLYPVINEKLLKAYGIGKFQF